MIALSMWTGISRERVCVAQQWPTYSQSNRIGGFLISEHTHRCICKITKQVLCWARICQGLPDLNGKKQPKITNPSTDIKPYFHGVYACLRGQRAPNTNFEMRIRHFPACRKIRNMRVFYSMYYKLFSCTNLCILHFSCTQISRNTMCIDSLF